MNPSESVKVKRHPIGRFFAFLLVTLLCLILVLLGMIWVLERGPSPTVTAMFTRSVRETSAIRWISNIFLSEEELEQYKSVSTEELERASQLPRIAWMASDPGRAFMSPQKKTGIS